MSELPARMLKSMFGKRFEVIDRLGGGDEGKKQPESGDFRRFLHDVHAEQVVGDDPLLDEIADAGMALFDLGQPGRQALVVRGT